jgi:general secretion pathway protein I
MGKDVPVSNSCANRPKPNAGFALIEALVALAVFATAAIALMQVQAMGAQALQTLERRALGEIVAENQLVSAAAPLLPPDLGQRQGETTLAGRVFTWQLAVEQTPAAATRRVSIVVFDASGVEAARAQAFVNQPDGGVGSPP